MYVYDNNTNCIAVNKIARNENIVGSYEITLLTNHKKTKNRANMVI